MLGLSSLQTYMVVAVASIALAAGAYFYVFHSGEVSERNSNAGKVLVETEADRKLRESNDAAARSLTDDAATKCLRNPSGC